MSIGAGVSIVMAGVSAVSVLVVVILVKKLKKAEEKVRLKQVEVTRLKTQIDMQAIQQKIKQEVQKNVEKQNEALQKGTVSERYNAARNILHNE